MIHLSVKSLPLQVLFLNISSIENGVLFPSSNNYIVNSVTEVDNTKFISNVSYKSFEIIGTTVIVIPKNHSKYKN